MPEKKSKLVEIKTKPTEESVDDFINKITDEQKRNDCVKLLEMMKKPAEKSLYFGVMQLLDLETKGIKAQIQVEKLIGSR